MKSNRTIYSLVLCISAFLMVNRAVFAGIFTLNPSSKTVNVGDTFTVDVNVDPGSDKLFGVQAFVLYNQSRIEAQSVSAGTYFPTVTKNIVTGKVYISGDTQIGSPISGTGTLATITFKALTTGTDTLSFLCDLNSNDTSVIGKNDASSTNVIECNRNGTMTVTIGGSNNDNSGGSTDDNNDDEDSGDDTNDSASTTSTQTSAPTTLPQTGAMDNFLFASLAGVALLGVAGVTRLVLKFR